MQNENNTLKHLRSRSTDELITTERNYLNQYKFDSIFDFRHTLNDLAEVMQAVAVIREKNPVPSTSQEFLGITDSDKRTFFRVAQLCEIAAELLTEQDNIDTLGYPEE